MIEDPELNLKIAVDEHEAFWSSFVKNAKKDLLNAEMACELLTVQIKYGEDKLVEAKASAA